MSLVTFRFKDVPLSAVWVVTYFVRIRSFIMPETLI